MRSMERFFAILLLIGGLAGAAAFAHRAGAPADSSFAAPYVQPAIHGASSQVLQIAAVPAVTPAATRLRPSPAPRPLRLAAPVLAGPVLAGPVRRLVPLPRHPAPVAVSAHLARPAPEPVVPVATAPAPAPAPAPPAPAPAAAPAPAPPPHRAAPAPTAPVVPPVVAPPTAHDHGNGKDRGKAKGKNKDVALTPVAETIAPVDPFETVAPTPPDVPVVASDDDKHGRGHDKDK
jgi:hypothetical protein